MELKQALREGVTLDHGKYLIVKILGQGGFGITYLAKDQALDKLVAIKEFFPKDYCDRDETTSQVTLGTSNTIELVSKLKLKFLKEARNIAKFDFPGIIRIHSAFEENNTAYYVMDYIEGETLSTIVKRDGPLSVERATNYISQVGSALSYIHSKHINHLDIKPANIMIRRSDERPILIDFGLSKQYDSEGRQTSTTPTGISHGYAPIEQYKDGGVNNFSPKTDLYSLAATYFYVLTGNVPPHATDMFEAGLTFPENFPVYLKAPIIKAMSPKRQNRHETIKDFVSEINKKEETEIKVNGETKKTEKFVAQGEVHKVEIVEIPPVEKPKVVPPVVEKPKVATPPITPLKEKKGQKPVEEKKEKVNEGVSQRTKNVIIWCVTAVIVFILVFWMISYFSSKSGAGVDDYNGNEDTEYAEVAEDGHITTMHNILIDTPLGKAVYTGEVNAENQPNGLGKATWNSGDALSYDGPWVNGNMEGPNAKYELRDGDTFEGEFKNNEYFDGKYTVASSGDYYQGKFESGQPTGGQWYNKAGEPL